MTGSSHAEFWKDAASISVQRDSRAVILRMTAQHHLGDTEQEVVACASSSPTGKSSGGSFHVRGMGNFVLFWTSQGSTQSWPISASSLQNLVRNCRQLGEHEEPGLKSMYRCCDSQEFLSCHQILNRLYNLQSAAYLPSHSSWRSQECMGPCGPCRAIPALCTQSTGFLWLAPWE